MRNLDANVKVFFKPFYMNSAVAIAKTVEIDKKFVWRIFFYGNKIDKNIPASGHISFVLNNENYKTFCNKLNKLNICTGNTDFQDVIDKGVNFPEPFPSAVAVRAAFLQSSQDHSKPVPEEFFSRMIFEVLIANINHYKSYKLQIINHYFRSGIQKKCRSFFASIKNKF